eukprot:Em0016g378a
MAGSSAVNCPCCSEGGPLVSLQCQTSTNVILLLLSDVLKIRGIVSGGEASALIQKEVLILSDEERRFLLDKAGISSSIELGQLRWLKSPGIYLAGEIAVFSFTISSGGEEIKGTPLVFIPHLVDKVVQLLDGNERTGRLTWHKGFIPANEIWLKIGGDKGGGTFKMTFQIVNVATPNSVHNTCVSSFLPLVTASPISMWHLISLRTSSCYCKITIGAFNVQQFGCTKLKTEAVVNSLVKVIHEYDIVLIQEILMKDDLFKSFVKKNVNQNLPINHDYKAVLKVQQCWHNGIRVNHIQSRLARPLRHEGSRGKEGYFFCMIGKCIDLKGDWGQGKKLVIGASTSNAISHLREVHNIVGERSEKMMSKKQRVDEIVSKKKRSMETMEASRYWALTVAQTVVHMLWPFNVVEDESFRYLVGEKCPKMSTKMLKRLVLELYIAAKESTMANFIRLKEQTKGLPLFHLNVDLWTLVRDSGRSSDILLQWVKDVLNEFGLQLTDLMSATTDAGSDIKRPSSSLIGCHWDWCMSHLLNCALVEAFGTSLDPTSSGNKAAREETRRKLFHAIDVRFLQRYSSMTDRSPMLDCCAFLYPPLSKLPYVNFILSTNVPSSDACTVEYVRTTTEKEIMKQALAHLKAKQQEGNASSTAAILAGASGVGKFSKDRAGACHLVDTSLSLLFGPQSEPESAVDAHIPPHIAIMQEIQRYKAEDINVSQCCPEESDVLKYWRLKKAEYPTLAIIARAFLGFAVSAAGIERDFCSAGSTITVRRNSLDNAIARQ